MHALGHVSTVAPTPLEAAKTEALEAVVVVVIVIVIVLPTVSARTVVIIL
jgi:hypothetical protein